MLLYCTNWISRNDLEGNIVLTGTMSLIRRKRRLFLSTIRTPMSYSLVIMSANAKHKAVPVRWWHLASSVYSELVRQQQQQQQQQPRTFTPSYSINQSFKRRITQQQQQAAIN